MDLAVLQRWIAAQTIRDDMLVNDASPLVQHYAAALTLRNAVRLAAAGHSQLANRQWEFLA